LPIVGSPTEDKVAIAGSLLGGRLALTTCETSDVDIPAHAELMIEPVLPNVREAEGPSAKPPDIISAIKAT